jgi:minichromosome maintenance protein 10
LVGDTLSGCWATVGVLTEKGAPKTSSTGKNYCIWKVGCLNENTVSLFLFGDAYQKNWKEQAGTVFALFNCAVRKDAMVSAFHYQECCVC